MMPGSSKAGAPRRSGSATEPDLRSRLVAFVTECFPFAVDALLRAIKGARLEGADLSALGPTLADKVDQAVRAAPRVAAETTPGVSTATRMEQARAELREALLGFFEREAIRASLTDDERREMLRGMLLTRATDNQLKAMFLAGEVRFEGGAFQGKGYRSLGQEAIYGAPLRLHRGAAHRQGETWQGDVITPMIRDLGAALAMRPTPETVRMVLNAQAGKSGPPMDGRDFHVGDFEWGILPAAAPLGIAPLSAAGLAMAFARSGQRRVVVTFIGEGGSSLGEWHEAINIAAVHRLPVVFCVQNNQTALSTPVGSQSAVRVFADKARGYGLQGVTIDGTDPEAMASAFSWAAERARDGRGPTLIETVAMRMCGHAHHDDMLYLGREPKADWRYPEMTESGYGDPQRYAFWSARDPIPTYARRLQALGLIDAGDLERLQQEVQALVLEEKRRVLDLPWPDAARVGHGVVSGEPARRHVEPLEERRTPRGASVSLPELEPGPEFSPKGRTFLDGVAQGVADALRADERVFVYGEDVGGRYGNAFLLLRPLLAEFGERLVNSPIAEAGVLGVCVGAALGGLRPIGEIQFNDFVATGFNQLVNHAAKIRYRWGADVPLVVRLPWGGLRNAGPYHSQNTEPWFYRTPGLKIVAPSTPYDARALLAAAVADPDPVLFYEHIALYRDPKIKQHLDEQPPPPIPLGRAALRRAGSDVALVSYGAYVHVCLEVANRVSRDGIECAVLDLRSLAPLDRESLLALARHCGKVLIAHEDSRTGGIGESLAALIQEAAFEDLDAPVRVAGALDTPVPYAPTLEREFLFGAARLERAVRLLAAY